VERISLTPAAIKTTELPEIISDDSVFIKTSVSRRSSTALPILIECDDEFPTIISDDESIG
jgi:hypothetical protein